LAPSNVVIVESPAKAKTINKYLGSDYTVIASYGHIRDLPPKDGSVRPDEDFAMDWELSDRASRPLDAITKAVKGAQHVFLATDPDREGEAISWHIEQVLRQKKLVGIPSKTADVQRVTFNEITKSAVTEAFKHARQVNQELVDAYMARRALDYLVGFNLSPVLWRKLPGSRSAGRVQSVALRLICERENEIERFVAREFWTISAELLTRGSVKVLARLTELDGKKLDKFALPDATTAKAAALRIEQAAFSVKSVEKKQVRRHPAPPFITSTLQQEASRKLGFSATKTMRTAQSLYEGMDIGGETVGLITYMRTDGITLSGEAIHSARTQIGKQFGDKYVPASPRAYKSTAKNAQEAHEAIRPTDLSRTPQAMARHLNPDERALYDLIWKRTIACQMESAVFDQVTVDFTNAKQDIGLRATGSMLVFDGFLTLYNEGRDDSAEDEESTDRRLPPLAERDALKTGTVKPDQHFTEPPPRYGEASLVKKLEELGIGRPSTYASIMQVLQDREYVRLEARRFVPADRGRIVTAFLSNFFLKYVEYGFTADLETKLDAISAGQIQWKALLAEFWQAFSAAIASTKELKISDVIEALDEDLYPFLFPARADGGDPRVCPTCGAGKLSLKLGKFGAFIGCSNYPDCAYTRPLAQAGEDGEAPQGDPTRLLGDDPVTGLPISAKVGPYGAYVQIGPAPNEKPKRVSLPKGLAIADLTMDTALQWLQLPREVGKDPETGKAISANVGRFGPYLKVGELFASLPKDEDVLTIGLNRAIDLIVEKRESLAKRLLRTLGDHPESGEAIEAYKGKFGPYLKAGKLMASLPKNADVDTMTLEDAVKLLADKGKTAAKKTKGKSGKASAKSKRATPAKSMAGTKA
jgi:DNA topoisomerase-1